MPIHPFQSLLKNWYAQHKRALPWRKTRDPYKIWLSEVILQQTRVNQGLPYYNRFVDHYPNVDSLAAASEDEVLKDWEGLGYYSRARNMKEAARYVSEELDGTFPDNYNDLLKLKGVGEYTAAAISSIVNNEKKAVVDGNVYRVLSRYLGIDTPINSGPGKKEFALAAREMLDEDDPATYNQAIMEFGALQCVPRSPDCTNCILNSSCYAYLNNKVTELPVKNRVRYNTLRYFHYIIISSGKEMLIKRREGKDIWKGLYQFPLVEYNSPLESKELKEEVNTWVKDGVVLNLKGGNHLKPHKLSHQTIFCSIWYLEIKREKWNETNEAWQWVDADDLSSFAFPRPLRRLLDTNQLTLPLE